MFLYMDDAKMIVAADVVVLGFDLEQVELQVLLAKRTEMPFRGRFTLPGSMVLRHEDTHTAAHRALSTKVGLNPEHLEQLYTFSGPKRDPRERAISVSYMALVQVGRVNAGVNFEDARWISLSKALETKLSFDHGDILRMAIARLKNKVRYTPIGFGLLPEEFTIRELRLLYEACLQEPLEESGFRKRALKMDVLVKVGTRTGGQHRKAPLYRFNLDRYTELSETTNLVL